jgi:hypothetical protein
MTNGTENKDYFGDKPRVCDECGYLIKQGVGLHERCEEVDEKETVDEPREPPNPEAVPQRDSPTQCGCPNCRRPRMDGARTCIKCYNLGCDCYKKWGVECD